MARDANKSSEYNGEVNEVELRFETPGKLSEFVIKKIEKFVKNEKANKAKTTTPTKKEEKKM